jgi:Zn-dependent peptidase ImmA (M78 family)/transcriptional regulator with XRE-family HTH domain
VKSAREIKGLTQSALAKSLGLNDRQSISDIENGKRSLQADEMLALADLLEQDIEFFIDPFIVTGEAQFNWRADPCVSEETLNDFEHKAGRYIGLLRWLREQGNPKPSALKQSLRLSMQSSYEDAQECAESLVVELGLGIIPAENLIDAIETTLDIPVLFIDAATRPEAGSISGATCHLDEMNVILINRNESEARRFFDLAHELFHALTWDRMQPTRRESNSLEERGKNKRIEQLADNFAAALLTPGDALNKLVDKGKINNISYLYDVATLFRVTPSALAWRLHNLKLIKEDTRQQLLQGKQWSSPFTQPKPFSMALVRMLHETLEHGRLSAHKAAKTMGLGLNELNELFAQYELHAPFEL